MRKVAGFFLLLLITVAQVHAQAQKPEGKTVVIKAARLFDGKSNSLVTPGMVIVANGKILAAGPNAITPAGAEVIDLGDATLLPGFIDAHTHLTMMNTTDYKQAALDSLQKDRRRTDAGLPSQRESYVDGGIYHRAGRRLA